MDKLQETKRLCESHGLDFKDCGNGHVQIIGKGALVNYWPLSKKRKAHLHGKKGIPNCNPYDAIKLALVRNGVADELKPPQKKITKNGPNKDALTVVTTNPAGIKNFYTGKRPPWEFDELIMCQTDRMRIAAYELESRAIAIRAQADDMEMAAFYTESNGE